MKITLIAPGNPEAKRHRAIFPPLNLGWIAAYTPEEYEVEILDEHQQRLDLASINSEVVGITVMTSFAPRAYQIADELRKRGHIVILGGMHPSALPDEAVKHADSIVVGEMEPLWLEVLEDMKKNELKTVYQIPERPHLTGLRHPRRDLWRAKDYLVPQTVQTTRGCPYACSFCAVSNFFGHTYRLRPVQDIIAEVKNLPGKLISFVDDNIIGHPQYAKELFTALIPLKKSWFGQASINFGKDPELLRLAAKSGCIGVFIGLESVSDANLRSIGKGINLSTDREKALKNIRSHGISVEGAFIFGFDEDDEEVFQRTVEYAEDLRLEGAQFGVLTPFPGTKLFEEMEKEKRILNYDWSNYTVNRVVFQPKGMSVQRLQDGVDWAYQRFFSVGSIWRRIGLIHPHVSWLWLFNLISRSRVREYVKRHRAEFVWN